MRATYAAASSAQVSAPARTAAPTPAIVASCSSNSVIPWPPIPSSSSRCAGSRATRAVRNLRERARFEQADGGWRVRPPFVALPRAAVVWAALRVDQRAAADVDRRGRHRPRLVRGREGRGVADVLERRRALEHRRVGEHLLEALTVVEVGGDRLRDPAGLERDDPDAVAA